MSTSEPSSPEEQQPQYPTYPQMPGYSEATPPQGPPPSPPDSVNWAARLLYILAGLGVLGTLLIFAFRDDLEEQIMEDNPDFTPSEVDDAVNLGLGFGVVLGLVFAALYVLLGRKLLQGRSWARIVSTVLLALAILGGLTGGAQSLPAINVILAVIGAIVAIAALVLLWRRPTSEYINEMTARRRAV